MKIVRLGPREVEITVAQGDDWNVPIVAFVGDDVVGNEIDLTDVTFIAQIRRGLTDEDEIVLTVDVTSAADGLIWLRLPKEDTDDKEGCYHFGLRADHPTTGRKTWLTGPWIVERVIAR